MNLTQNKFEKELADLKQDREERVAIIERARAWGKINNQQADIEIAEIKTASSKEQLKLIQNRIAEVQFTDKKDGKVSVELLKELRKQEAEMLKR